MLIARDQMIAGLSAPAVRGVLRELSQAALSTDRTREALRSAGAEDPDTTLAELQRLGYIEVIQHPMAFKYDDDDLDDPNDPRSWERLTFWDNTVLGTALTKARIGKPIPRARGDAILSELLERIKEVNADPDELFWVETVELFGSMTNPEREEVGDIDLRITFARRYDGEDFMRRNRDRAKASGRTFGTIVDKICFSQREFERRVRGRSQRVDAQFDDHENVRPLPDGATIVPIFDRNQCSA